MHHEIHSSNESDNEEFSIVLKHSYVMKICYCIAIIVFDILLHDFIENFTFICRNLALYHQHKVELYFDLYQLHQQFHIDLWQQKICYFNAIKVNDTPLHDFDFIKTF